MQKQMTPEHVTILTSSQTNSTETIANRFKQDEKRSHWPPRSTRQEQTHKFFSLTGNSQICNSSQQPQTQSQSKTGLPSDGSQQRKQSKRITNDQQKEQNPQPNRSCFSPSIRLSAPSPRQTIGFFQNVTFCAIFKNRKAMSLKTPFKMNTLQCLSIPKTTDSLLKTMQSTGTYLRPPMMRRVQTHKNQSSCYNAERPLRKGSHTSHKRKVNAQKWNRLPCFCCRRKKQRRIHHFLLILEKKKFGKDFVFSFEKTEELLKKRRFHDCQSKAPFFHS